MIRREPRPLADAKIAIVHEWLAPFAGSERVVTAMLRAFPRADLYAIVHDPEKLRGTPLEGVPVKTTFIQSLPKAKERYRSYLPLMPLAVEQLDLRLYDLVISSNHAAAKGVLTRADQLHVSYVHTPVRYAWDLYLDYLEESRLTRGPKSWLARSVLHYLRIWDSVAANRVDAFVANSYFVARRINKLYRRSARVIHPPVDIQRYRSDLPREEFYVAVSRFVPYKRMGMIVETFSRTGKPLVVIGEGPELERARRMARSNVRLLGPQPDEIVADHLQRARALVFAAEEDFGIVPVEAQAAGCPVIAYGRGGVLESVVGWPAPGATGIFFEAQTTEALEAAIDVFEAHERAFDPKVSRRNAERFGGERFRHEFADTVEGLWKRFENGEPLE